MGARRPVRGVRNLCAGAPLSLPFYTIYRNIYVYGMHKPITIHRSSRAARAAGNASKDRIKQWQGVKAGSQGGNEKMEPVSYHLPYAERVRSLAKHSQAEGMVFQSVAVSSLQALRRTLACERQVARAAISMAQGEKLQEMIGTLETTIAALGEILSLQGEKMLDLCAFPEMPPGEASRSWWFALTEAIEVLEKGSTWITGLVSGQPKGSAARTLGSIVVRLLHRHHNALLLEADQWMGDVA